MKTKRTLLLMSTFALLAIMVTPVLGCDLETKLWAGSDHFEVGLVQVTESGGMLYIKYVTYTSWYLAETNLEVASSFEDIPQTGSGNPKIGKFTYKTVHDPMVTEFTYVVPRGSGMLYIAAHAVVFHDVGEGYCETAWGQGPTHQEFPGRSWALYFTYPAPA